MKIIATEVGYRIVFNDGARISRVFSSENEAAGYIAQKQEREREFSEYREKPHEYLKQSRWFENYQEQTKELSPQS